jgi:divalent metal cation (Fe/Co/Zn/Cd) transporter
MSDVRSSSVNSKSQLPIWATIVGGFIAASGIQILFYGYGAPAIAGCCSRNVLGLLYFPLVVFWLFVPAALAALVSVRLLRSGARRVGSRITAQAVVAVAVLALLSSYVGAVVSVNTWGT